jgi:hypothetical protein
MSTTSRHAKMTRSSGRHSKPSWTRMTKLLPVVTLLTFLLPASPAYAQATRTWVSGVGDDANPCSRTAPCKTFAGAISKTAANGEINTLDPGGFGAVTITKSITIQACTSGVGSVLVSGANAIVINAGVNDSVTLRCLDMNGVGSGLNAIRVLSAKTVKIMDTEIYGFVRNAVDLESSNPAMNFLVANSFIHDNSGAGVMVAPTTSGVTKGTLRNNEIVSNGCGVVATQYGVDPASNYAVDCGTQAPDGDLGRAVVYSVNNLFSEQATVGVFSRGGRGTNRIAGNQIFNNDNGLRALDGGSILSWGDNYAAGNNPNGAATGTLTPL